MRCIRFLLCIIFATTILFALEPAKTSYKLLPKLRGDEPIQSGQPIPYLGGRQSPGVQIGITTYDLQSSGSFGQRLALDDNGNIHIDWMWCGGAYPGPRYCAWNFRFTDNTWYGEVQAAPSVSGYVQLDIVRDANPDNQVSAICYHYDAGAGYYSWVDTDAGQGWGLWPNNPVTPAIPDHIWPKFTWTENGNIVLATGDYNPVDFHHLYVSTDSGNTWMHIASFDSCGTLSYFLRASYSSNKVVFVHTQMITDQPNVQLDNDVYYMLSTDGGVTWGPHTNITNYQTNDTVRAYCNVNAVFDYNDNLHIAWAGRRCTYPDMWEASHIFHWDEVSGTITQVSSPSSYYVNDWWIATTTSPSPGAWRMPADQPQLIAAGPLFCLWHGNDDYNDGSATGYFNGEIYGSISRDNGRTWTPYTNLTNTRTPGAPPGACDDEDYMTANPFFANDSICLTYVEDKDAGAWPQTEGVMTTNPVRCWRFWAPGVAEDQSFEVKHTAFLLEVYPNPFHERINIRYMIQDTSPPHSVRRGQGYKIQDFSLKIFDASGQLVRQFDDATIRLSNQITWDGTDHANRALPGGIYFVHLETENYRAVEKVVLLK